MDDFKVTHRAQRHKAMKIHLRWHTIEHSLAAVSEVGQRTPIKFLTQVASFNPQLLRQDWLNQEASQPANNSNEGMERVQLPLKTTIRQALRRVLCRSLNLTRRQILNCILKCSEVLHIKWSKHKLVRLTCKGLAKPWREPGLLASPSVMWRIMQASHKRLLT